VTGVLSDYLTSLVESTRQAVAGWARQPLNPGATGLRKIYLILKQRNDHEPTSESLLGNFIPGPKTREMLKRKHTRLELEVEGLPGRRNP